MNTPEANEAREAMRGELAAMTKRAEEAERFADHQTCMAINAEVGRNEAEARLKDVYEQLSVLRTLVDQSATMGKNILAERETH